MLSSRATYTGAVAAITAALTGCAAGSNALPPPSATSTPGPRTVWAAPAPSRDASSGRTAAPPVTETNPPGDIPDSQAYVEVQPAGAKVAVKVPEGWGRTTTRKASGTVTAFADKLNRVSVSGARQVGPLTTETVTKTMLPALRAVIPKFVLTSVSPVRLPAGTGVLVRYQADSTPDPVTGKVVRDAVEQYIFARGPEQVSLTLAGPTNADNVDPWRTVSTSLRWR